MNRFLHLPLIALAPLALPAASDLSIKTAVELAYPTEPGKYYQLQHSNSLENDSWSNIGLAIAGTGDPVEALFPRSGQDFYRVIELQNQWALIWADEFDGDKLDLCKWGKVEDNYGGGNNEQQHYSTDEKYAYVEDGALHIAVYRDPYTSVDGKTQPYSSARLRTLQRGDWKYGRIEVRAKVPGGEGIWPAAWMLPSQNIYGIWAASGEIDIMESKGTQIDRTYATIHFGGEWPNNTYTGSTYFLPEGNFADDFYTYAIEWWPDRIDWYIDDVKIQTLTKDQWYSTAAPDSTTAPFDQKFHLILNVAVNGGFFNGTGQNANNLPDDAFPQVLEVDYARVYQWAEGR